MITTYILILCVSAWFAAYSLLRLSTQLSRIAGRPLPVPAGAFALIAVLGFLIVVSAPPALIVGALVLGGVQLMGLRHYLPPIAHWGVPLIASLLMVSSVTIPATTDLPPALLQAAALALPFVLVMGSAFLPNDATDGSTALLACLIPLIAAPLLGAASFLAIDSGLIAAALLGMLMACAPAATLGLARAPFAFILGWLIVQAAAHGAWIPAALSLLVYGAAIAYGMTHEPAEPSHAS